jgi:hypothetical protein
MDDLALDYFQDSQVLIPPAPEVNSTTLEASIDGLVPIYSKSNAYSSRVVSSTRTTACDIMCTANTSRPYKVPVPTTLKKKKATAHLPYKPKDLTVGGFDGDGTTLEQLKSVDSKEKRNMQFITEKYRFLTALYENRDLETADENVAATIIQARYRGYRIRKRLKGRASFTIDASPSSVSYTKATATKKIWKEPVTLMMLQVELIQMAEGLGLNPIVGLNIHGLLKKNAKQRRLERRAAQCIRNLFMKTLVVSRARAVVNQKREQKRHRAALRIQKFFRFVMAKKLLSVDQDRERSMQIVRVQRLARGFIARVRLVYSVHLAGALSTRRYFNPYYSFYLFLYV